MATLIGMVQAEGALALAAPVRAALMPLVGQLASLQVQIAALDKVLLEQRRSSAASRRLETIPGYGVVLSTAMVATITDPTAFKSGRDLAAWIGLVPRQNSSGGKERLGGISKQGDRYLRKLLVVGAAAVLRQARIHPDRHPWLMQLLARRPAKVAIVALANKMARIAWAVLVRGETCRAPALAVGAAAASARGA